MKRLFLFLIFISITVLSSKAQWSQVNIQTSNFNYLTRVQFLNQNLGFASAGGLLYKTTDSGNNWIEVQLTWSTNAPNLSKDFVSSQVGYGVSYNRGLKTVDGGRNWSIIKQSILSQEIFRGLDFYSPIAGYLVSVNPFTKSLFVHKTQSGGVSWITDTISNMWDVFDMQFTSPDTGYIVGVFSGDGMVVKTFDGGISWESDTLAGIGELAAVHFINNDMGFIIGEARGSIELVKTVDAGQNWTYHSVEAMPPNDELNDIWFTGQDTGYVVGDNGRFLYTIDGGYNWNALSTNFDGKCIYFLNKNTGFISGTGSRFLKTNTGGFSIITNVEELNHDRPNKQTLFYPNPAKEMLQIQAEENGFLSIYSADGRLVLHKLLKKGNVLVGVSQIEKGMYYADFQFESFSKREKLIIVD